MQAKASKLLCKGNVWVYLNKRLVRFIPNLVVNAGLAQVAGLLVESGTAPSYVAIGTGTTPPAAGDTTLQAEYARGTATRSVKTTSVTNDTAVFERVFSFAESVEVTEAGLLNAASEGTLTSRSVFSAVSVPNGGELLVRWEIQVAAS